MSRALWGVAICGAFFGLQVAFHPFTTSLTNAAQDMLLFAAVLVASINVVLATLSTNATSTTDEMDDQTTFLITVEATLLLLPISVIAAWQAYVFRNEPRGAFAACWSFITLLICRHRDATEGDFQEALLGDDAAGLSNEHAPELQRTAGAAAAAESSDQGPEYSPPESDPQAPESDPQERLPLPGEGEAGAEG